MNPSAYVLLADMVDSRGAERAGLMERVDRALACLQQPAVGEPETGAARGGRALRVQRTKGVDEFAIVFDRPGQAFAALVTVNEQVAPARFRAALADGEIDVGADQGDIRNMDGEAFHRASDGLAQAKEAKHPFQVNLSGLGEAERDLIHAATALHEAVHATLTDNQLETLSLYRVHNNQAQVAQLLDKTQPAVSGALRAAFYRQLFAVEDAVSQALEQAVIEDDSSRPR